MLELSFNQGMEMDLEQSLELEQNQELGLKALISISQRQIKPKIPKAKRGKEGMQVADAILKERESTGILIGSLVESIWTRKRKLDDHKDVDVMVTSDHFYIDENFKGGVDWWIPSEESLRINIPGGYMDNIPVKWWSNGHWIALNFGIIPVNELEPGLHIPNYDWYITMRTFEALSQVDGTAEGVIDEEVVEQFQNKFRKRVRKEMETVFDYPVISQSDIEIAGTDLDYIRAVNVHLKQDKK